MYTCGRKGTWTLTYIRSSLCQDMCIRTLTESTSSVSDLSLAYERVTNPLVTSGSTESAIPPYSRAKLLPKKRPPTDAQGYLSLPAS